MIAVEATLETITTATAMPLDQAHMDLGLTTDATAFLPSYVDPEEADGLWHVTVARDAVLADGLKSRAQLERKVQGLGGGHNNQAPHLVSLTWSSGKAEDIKETLILAARAARNEVQASEILSQTEMRYGSDFHGDVVRRALSALGVPSDIAEDEWLGGLNEWLDENVVGGEAKYSFLQDMDDAMEKEFDRTEELPVRVGLTAPYEVIANVDPDQICILSLAVRTGAAVEINLEESEMRVSPADLVVVSHDAVHEDEDVPQSAPAGEFAHRR